MILILKPFYNCAHEQTRPKFCTENPVCKISLIRSKRLDTAWSLTHKRNFFGIHKYEYRSLRLLIKNSIPSQLQEDARSGLTGWLDVGLWSTIMLTSVWSAGSARTGFTSSQMPRHPLPPPVVREGAGVTPTQIIALPGKRGCSRLGK